MRTKVLSANQRIVIGVVDQNFGGEKIASFARTLKRVGLTLEIESKDSKELVLFAARRVVTNDISIPQAEPKPKPGPVIKAGAA